MLFMPTLSFLFFLPLLAILIILTIRGKSENTSKNIKYIAVLTTFIHFLLTIFLWLNFDKVNFSYQFVEKITLLPRLDISYYLGIDGISLLFLSFSSLIILLVMVFINMPPENSKLYAVSYLIILLGATGTFISLDIIMFYVFYELSIIPVFFIVGILGTGNKIYATFKFMLYTIAASVLMLVAIITMLTIAKTSSIIELNSFAFTQHLQMYLFWGLFIAFAVKGALFPVHTWMPDTYDSAPISINIIMSAILMKYAIYGLIRLVIPMFPLAIIQFSYLVYALAWITVVYCALIAFRQENIKVFFAYFSISHMALIIAGIFATNTQGLEGAVYQSISHTIFNTGLFLGVLYLQRRYNSNKISDFSGIAATMPKLATALFIFVLASIGFPLTNAFIGEFLLLFGIFQDNRLVTIFFTLTILMSAIVGITFARKVIFGKTSVYTEHFKDLTFFESLAMIIIVAIVIFMGIYPDLFLDVIRTSITNIYEQFNNGIIISNDI